MTRRKVVGIAGLSLVLVAAAAVVWFRPPAGDHRLEDAHAALNAGDPSRAEEIVRDFLRERPDDPSANLVLTRSLRQQARHSEAEAVLVRAVQKGLPEAEGRREFALLLAAQDWPPQAAGILQRAARDHPNDPEVLLAVAGAFAAKGRWAEAGALYNQLLAINPEQSEWRLRRGLARMRAADFAPAATDFRQVLAADPSHFEARLYLAHSLLGDAQMGAAEQELNVCRKERPDRVEPLVGLAKCALEKDNLAAAEDLLNQAAAIEPNSPLVLQDLAALYLRRQRNDLAVDVLRRLLALDSTNKQAHLNLAQALLASGRPDEARRHEQAYQELDRQEEQRLTTRRGMR